MMRVRLRKLWVILAILLCFEGIWSLREIGQKEVNAAQPSSSTGETTKVDQQSGQYKMWFLTQQGGDLPFTDTDGMKNMKWNMKTSESNDFVMPNTGTVTARVSIGGETKADLTGVIDRLIWEYTITGANGKESEIINILPATTADTLGSDGKLRGDSTKTELKLAINPKTAGLVSVNFHVTGVRKIGKDSDGNDTYDEKNPVINISRTITIGSPLQIYSYPETQPRTYTYFTRKEKEENKKITFYANNYPELPACKIYWFFVDVKGNYISTSPTWVELQKPTYTSTDNLSEDSKIMTKPIEAEVNNDPKKEQNPQIRNSCTVYAYNFYPKQEEGGFTRMVGRIYLGGDSKSDNFVECVYDVVNAADFKEGLLTGEGVNKALELQYGKEIDFRTLANDRNKTLGWASYSNWNESDYEGTREGDVVIVGENKITAKNYGTVTLVATALFEGWEYFSKVAREATDFIKVKVAADVLKGNASKEIIDYASEVITVGGTIQLSTNVVGKNYNYQWFYYDEVNWVPISQTSSPKIFKASGVTSASAQYSSIILTGLQSGRAKMKCEVDIGTETITKEFTIKVVDTMTLSETRKTIAVGSSFEIQAFISATNSGTNNPVVWTVEEGKEDYITIDSRGQRTSALVTGEASTNNVPVRCTATYEIGGTTVSANFYVTVIPAIKGAHIEASPNHIISVGGSTNLELILDTEGTSFSSDQIKWILKDVKNQPLATEVLEKTDDPSDILKTKVKGLQVGEAYVAAVTNDEAQTEIAVITIKVVSEVTGLTLSEHEVKGYLPKEGDKENTGTFVLTATPEPRGYTDTENLGIEWSAAPDNGTVTIEPDPDDPLKATVTYHKIGIVRVTANVSGLPAAADFCMFTIENAAEKISLRPEGPYELRVGGTILVTPVLTPEEVTDPNVKWTMENERIATVSQAGVITGIAPGTTFVTCTTSNGLSVQYPVTVLNPVKSIELNYMELVVKKGTVFFLSANVLPENAVDRTVTWSSSDESICSVDEFGTVTANTTGTCTIIATSKDDPTITAECKVTVTESVAGITLNYREKTLKPQETFVLKATVLPSDANDKGVTFTSSNPAVATVTEDGLVTGVAGGTTIIVVRTNDRGLIATCTVTVQQDVTGITFDVTDVYLPKGENRKISYTLNPPNATIRDLEWTSSDPAIAFVDSEGYVHGVALGEVTITATAKDGSKISATCKVTVINPITEIRLSETSLIMMEGDEHTLTYTIVPQNATVTNMTWTSSDVSIATVNGMGIIKALREGETRIRVTSTDNSGVYAECIVIVKPYIPITSIRLNSTETTMILGESRKLTDRTYPNNTTEQTRWHSSDTGVVTVDGEGNLQAVGAGTCTISKFGVTSGIEGTCTVHVIGLTATDITLEKYDTFDLYLDEPNTNIIWFSRDKRTATVSGTGKVTGRRPGVTYIVADLNGKLVSCKVTVTDMVRTQPDTVNTANHTNVNNRTVNE